MPCAVNNLFFEKQSLLSKLQIEIQRCFYLSDLYLELGQRAVQFRKKYFEIKKK